MKIKIRQPEIITNLSRRIFVGYPSGSIVSVPSSLNEVFYPDRRIAPRVCERTGMKRDFCCCAPCRALRRRKHRAACRCWLCIADQMGGFIDRLGERTRLGRWILFLTLTYRTPAFPWARGFPIEQPQPHTDFVRNFIGHTIRHLEKELSERVEYFQAEQFGSVGGRIHQHTGLSALALENPARELAENLAAHSRELPNALKAIQAFLWDKAGFNRILPWEKDAAFYIGRYVGRDAGRCNWDWSVGDEHAPDPCEAAPVGRIVIAPSADLPSTNYHNILRRWHR